MDFIFKKGILVVVMDEYILKQLKERFDAAHLEKRIKRQQQHQAFQFRGGFHVYWENMHFLVPLLQFLLKTTRFLRRGFINSINFEIVENDVAISHLPPAFDGFTILHLSDLHIDGMFDCGRALVNKVSQLNYDVCVITGDFRFLTYGQTHESFAYTKRLVNTLKLKAPVYGILGNHDFIEMVPELESTGMKMLVNEAIPLQRDESTIGLAGVDDEHFYESADLLKAMNDINTCDIKILLAHSQELIKSAEAAGISLYLCGHTHGGQVCLPGGIAMIKNTPHKPFSSFIAGPWQYKTLQGYTSRGAGTSGLCVRFNCRPEITLHRLKKSS